jgi:RNA polymerase sigma factor (sigma-70 family)
MHDDLTALVTGARNGDKQAWDELVERYAPLIWSICRRYRLGRADAEDVGQSVWLRLVDQLASLRAPAALPGWLATTAQRECGRVLRAARKHQPPGHPVDAADIPDQVTEAAEYELIRAERHAALREAFMHLPPGSRKLISLLIQDPPVSYAEISARLGIPVGSIGPSRGRCLDKLRRDPAITALTNAETAGAGACIQAFGAFLPDSRGATGLPPCRSSALRGFTGV